MNERNFADILDECVSRLQDGEPVDSILASHPQDADQLRSLLRAAAHGQDLPKPEANPKMKADGKERVIAAAGPLQSKHKTLAAKVTVFSRYTGRMMDWLKTLFVKKEKTEMKLAYRAVLYTLILVVIGGVFTVNTSAKSLPGEPLYGVKRGWERARLALTFDEQSEQELEDEFEAERLEEVSVLVDERRLADVEFEGTVDRVEDELWTIGGFVVLVNQDTEINGDPGVGSRVEVEGHTQEDGTILAFELETVAGNEMDDDDEDMDDVDYEEQEVYGTLESLSGDNVVVDGLSYLISPESEMEDGLGSGDYVKVKYYEDEDGNLIALEVELEDQDMDDDDEDMDDVDYEEQEVYGTLESLSGDNLVVDGLSYLITPESEMDDGLGSGDYVKVKYYENDDGDLIALEVELEDQDMDDDDKDMDDEDFEEQEVYGTLESLSDDSLVVEGVTYLIGPESEMEDGLGSGDYVKVKYYENDDGNLIALEVELEDQDMDDDDDEDMDDEDYEEQEAYGTLESLSDDSLIVDGVTYLIEEDAELEEDLAAGDPVAIEFYENEDGDLVLLEIEVDDDAMATPSPTDEDDDDDSEEDEGDDDDDDDDDDGGED